MNDLPHQEKYIRPEEASKILKVTTRTLELWECAGKLRCVRTKGGHRRFLLSDVLSKANIKPKQEKICYCRVSTSSQKEDLERQVEFFRLKYPNHRIIKDIGSGLNFKRKGFNSILESAIRGNIEEIVVTHRDRLCRFGFELFERILTECSNGKIMVLDNEETSPEKELVGDLISIVTVFSSRLYGLRSHKIRKKIREATQNTNNEAISNQGTTRELTNNV